MSLLQRIVVVVAAVAVIVSVVSVQSGRSQAGTGLMPEVVVMAERPRLVMDTVVITASRMVAVVPVRASVN